MDQFPHLATYASNSQISCSMALQQHLLLDLFNLPMSAIAFQEYEILEVLLNGQRDDMDKDTWKYGTINGAIHSQSLKHMLLCHNRITPRLLSDGYGKAVLRRSTRFLCGSS
jgi:hypothetical protein